VNAESEEPMEHQLTELQVAVMRVLWERGEATVAEIWEALWAERQLAQTTVATLLSRLEKRGVVSHRVDVRQYVYAARVTEADVKKSMVKDLTERLFDGDVAALMSHLLTARAVKPGDLARVKKLIETHEKSRRGEGA
jgi:BlaI family transcriptional regulator, penicillinase repressor